MVPVRITAADIYDLGGEVVGARAMVGDALAARRRREGMSSSPGRELADVAISAPPS